MVVAFWGGHFGGEFFWCLWWVGGESVEGVFLDGIGFVDEFGSQLVVPGSELT